MVKTPEPPISYKNTGLSRIVKAGGYSLKGIRSALSGEAAFRQESILAIASIPFIVLMEHTAIERTLLVLVTFIVLIVELLNSAVEAAVDRIGLEYNLLSGQAKDMGSAAVFLSLILWAYVWIEVLINV